MSDTTSLSSQVGRLNISDTPSTSQNGSSELAAVVDDLLNQLNSKFTSISAEILGKMDEMSQRLDALESNIVAGNASAATATGSQGGEEK